MKFTLRRPPSRESALSICLATLFFVTQVLFSPTWGEAAFIKQQIPPVTSPSAVVDLPAAPIHKTKTQSVEPSSSRPFSRDVLIIQDIHLNVEAQRLIGDKIAQFQSQQDQPILVGVEGAIGKFDFRPFQKISDSSVLQDIANVLLEKNLISGPSWIGLKTISPDYHFVGVDDATLYTANVDAMKRAVYQRTMAEMELKESDMNLNRVADQFPAPIQKGSNLIRAYFDGKEDLMALVNYADDVQYRTLPSEIKKFKRVVDLETKWTAEGVQANREQLISSLIRKNEGMATVLMNLAKSLRAGSLSHQAFNQELFRLAKMYGVSLEPYSHLKQHHRYLVLSYEMDPSRLFQQTYDLLHGLISHVSSSTTERDFLNETFNQVLKKKLVRFELTPSEWEEVQSRRLDTGLYHDFSLFYEFAEKRNEKIVSQFLAARNEFSRGPSVLVVGGFHTPGIKMLLDRSGLTYDVYTPPISKLPFSGSNYLSEFLVDHAPLSKLFLSPRLTVALASRHLGAQRDRLPAHIGFPVALPVLILLLAGVAGLDNALSTVEILAMAAASGGIARLISVRNQKTHVQIGKENYVVGPDTALSGSTSNLGDVSGSSLAYQPLSLGLTYGISWILYGMVTRERLPWNIYVKHWAPKIEVFIMAGLATGYQFLFSALGLATIAPLLSVIAGMMTFYLWHMAESFVSGALFKKEALGKDVFWRFKGTMAMTIPYIVVVLFLMAGLSVLPVGSLSSFLSGSILGIYIVFLIGAVFTIPTHQYRNFRSLLLGYQPLAFNGNGPVENPLSLREQTRLGHGPGLTLRNSLTHAFFGTFVSILFLIFLPSHLTLWFDFFIALPTLLVYLQTAILFFLSRFPAPKSREGYRLTDSLKRQNAIKIGWLKFIYPELAKHPHLFNPNDPNSIYNDVRLVKWVWLSDLNPTLPKIRVILVNENNADRWSQFFAIPLIRIQQWIQWPLLRWGLWGYIFNPFIIAVNYFSYYPAALLSFLILPFVGLYEWYIYSRLNREIRLDGKILTPRVLAYLKDYRDHEYGTQYKKPSLDYINSNPTLMYQGKSQKLSDIMDGLHWKHQLTRIIEIFPPLEPNGLLTPVDFYELQYTHANPDEGGVGAFPQPETDFQPLPDSVPRIDLTQLSEDERQRGEEFKREALLKGLWGKIMNFMGAGRRFVGHSRRVPDFITKAILKVFHFNFGVGIKNAVTMILSSHSQEVPKEGKMRVAIVDQRANHAYVETAVLRDHQRQFDGDKVDVSIHTAEGIPGLNETGGPRWVDPEDLGYKDDVRRTIMSPPGSLVSPMELLVDGTLLEWALDGVRYVKVPNGEDAGGVPDGNEMMALEEFQKMDQNGIPISMNLIDRKLTYTFRGVIEDKPWEAKVTILGGKMVFEAKGLPKGVEVVTEDEKVSFLNDAAKWNVSELGWDKKGDQTSVTADDLRKLLAPELRLDGKSFSYTITGIQFEKGGTPMWDAKAGRFVIKDDHELTHLEQFEQDRIRLAVPLFNTNQANIHLPAFLRAIGFWEGEDDAKIGNDEKARAAHRRRALAKWRSKSPDERRDVIRAMLKGIPPGVDTGKLAEGSDVTYHRLGWKLGDLLYLMEGAIIVIDRFGRKTKAGYQALKGDGDIHDQSVLENLSRYFRGLLQEASEPFRRLPRHFTTVTAAMMIFVSGSLFSGTDAWHPNLWGLPRQQIGTLGVQTFNVGVDTGDSDPWTGTIVIEGGNKIRESATTLPAGITVALDESGHVLFENRGEQSVPVLIQGQVAIDYDVADVNSTTEPILEPREPPADAILILPRVQILSAIEKSPTLQQQYNFGPFMLAKNQINPAFEEQILQRAVEILIFQIYRMGWQIVVQKEGEMERGISVDENSVSFAIAPALYARQEAFDLEEDFEIAPFYEVIETVGSFGVDVRPLRPRTSTMESKGENDIGFTHHHQAYVRSLWERMQIRARTDEDYIGESDLKLSHTLYTPEGVAVPQRGIAAVVRIHPEDPLGKSIIDARNELSGGLPEPISQAIRWRSNDRLRWTAAGLEVEHGDRVLNHDEVEAAKQVATEVFTAIPQNDLVARGIIIDPRSLRLVVVLGPREGQTDYFINTLKQIGREKKSNENPDGRLINPRNPEYTYIHIGRIVRPLTHEQLLTLVQKINEEFLSRTFGILPVREVELINHSDNTLDDIDVIARIPLALQDVNGDSQPPQAANVEFWAPFLTFLGFKSDDASIAFRWAWWGEEIPGSLAWIGVPFLSILAIASTSGISFGLISFILPVFLLISVLRFRQHAIVLKPHRAPSTRTDRNILAGVALVGRGLFLLALLTLPFGGWNVLVAFILPVSVHGVYQFGVAYWNGRRINSDNIPDSTQLALAHESEAVPHLSDLLETGLAFALQKGWVTRSQVSQVYSRAGLSLLSVPSFEWSRFREIRPSHLVRNYSFPKPTSTMELDVLGSILGDHLKRWDVAFARRSGADPVANYFETLIELLGSKAATDGSDVAQDAVIVLGLMAGAGLPVNENSLADITHQLNVQQARMTKTLSQASEESTQDLRRHVPYFSLSDLELTLAQSKSNDTVRNILESRLRQMARAMIRTQDDQSAPGAWLAVPSNELKGALARLQKLFNDVGLDRVDNTPININLLAQSVRLHDTAKADPFSLALALEGTSPVLAYPIQMDQWNFDWTQFRSLQELYPEIVNQIIIRGVDLASGLTVPLHTRIFAALQAFRAA